MSKNHLLNQLSATDIALLGPPELLELALGDRLETAGEQPSFVYFFESGLASVIATVGNKTAEVGLTGLEGFVGSGVVDGDDRAAFDCHIQVKGAAVRFSWNAVREAVNTSPSLSLLLQRYNRAFNIQVAFTAWCNGHANLEARLSRWLLMVADRVGPDFEITHQYISIMLAVRRSGVTLATQVLEGQGLIRAGRGKISIVNRDGLIERAGGGYGLAESEQTRLLGEP